MMRAIEIAGFGGPEVLRPVVRARPVAGAGEALIRVTASGVNRPDVLQRKGHYPVPPGASDLPGLEMAGTIVGGDATALAPRASRSATASARWWPVAATPSTAWRRSARCLPTPAGFSDIESASAAGELLHRLVQRVRPRSSGAGE
jgi:NADPH2:quinone reductase